MTKKTASTQHLDRLAASLAASFPSQEHPGDHGYELSSSFVLAEKRRLLDHWAVSEHHVGDTSFIQHFIATTLRGVELEAAVYESSYHFMDGICVRKSAISGALVLPDSKPYYQFHMSLALQWVLEPQCLLIRPILGYQYASLDNAPAAVRELADNGEWQRIAYSFEHDDLRFSDHGDEKRLRRIQR